MRSTVLGADRTLKAWLLPAELYSATRCSFSLRFSITSTKEQKFFGTTYWHQCWASF